MEATTTQDPGLKSVPDPTDDEPNQDAPDAPGDENDAAAEATSETAAHEEEMRAEEARLAAEVEAKDQLSFPIGGIRPATAMIQVTGGAVEIAAAQLPDKDEEMTIAVKGWVKTVSDSTTKKGVSATRTAIFVVEEVDLQRLAS